MRDRDQQVAPRGSNPRADAAPDLGQALQDHIEDALQPAMAELRERITASVRRELEEQVHAPDRDGSDEMAEPRASASPELGQALQEQISQAFKPAMAEFREQMAATVRRELDETLHQDRRRAPADGERSTNRGQAHDEPRSDQDADQSEDDTRSAGADPSGERGSQAIRPLRGKPLLEALPEILEQQGEHWLRSQLDLGIDFVFSPWVRTAVQRESEHGLQRGARVVIELIPDRTARDDLRAQWEQTVERMVGTALDKLFADDVREDLKARGHRAIGALFQPNLKSILQHVQELLLSLLEGVLAVLRECWEEILQLLTRVVVALLQSRITARLKDAFASLATPPERQGEKKGAGSSTAVDEDGNERRRSSTEPAEDGPPDGAREPSRSQQRGRERERSADSDDDGADERPGRAPSRRPPAGRQPTTRQTSGRSFSDRSVSGRTSRAASR